MGCLPEVAERTTAARSARCEWSERDGDPLGPIAGQRACGVVDFGEEFFFGEIFYPPLFDPEGALRSHGEVIITAGDKDIYLKGEPDVARGRAPRRTLRGRHPLWLLSVLQHADAAGTAGELTVVRGVETRRYEFTFDTRQIERRIGERLDRPHVLRRPPFPAVLWLDDDVRTLLFGPHSRFVDPNGTAKQIWSTTELWDFGVEIAGRPRLLQLLTIHS